MQRTVIPSVCRRLYLFWVIEAFGIFNVWIMSNKKCLMKWSVHWSNYFCNHLFDFSAISAYMKQLKGYWIDMKRPPPPKKKPRNSISIAYTTKRNWQNPHNPFLNTVAKNVCVGVYNAAHKKRHTLMVKNLPFIALAYRHWLHYPWPFKAPRYLRYHRNFVKCQTFVH